MSKKLPAETNPQILVNGKHHQEDAEGRNAPNDQCLEDTAAEETETQAETQAKMQSVFQQVRNQIRSQVGMKAPKSGILELVQRVKERGTEVQARVNGEEETQDVQDVTGAEVWTDKSKEERRDSKQEALCALLEEKLAADKKAMRDELEAQICQVRAEMRAYTDQALKDLECKMQKNWKLNNSHLQQASTAPAPSLAARRGRVLTRTMTTILPKTCVPVIVGPRAKSETLSSKYKGESSRLVLLRDPVISRAGNKTCPSRKPLLPTCPPVKQQQQQQRKKALQAKTGK